MDKWTLGHLDTWTLGPLVGPLDSPSTLGPLGPWNVNAGMGYWTVETLGPSTDWFVGWMPGDWSIVRVSAWTLGPQTIGS